jgi:uncharacterized membrane protein YcaP (DUF421 family)
MEPLLGILLRVSIMYVYTLLILRLSGRRSIDSMSPQDFIVAVILGDMFDDVFWSEVTVAMGIVGITTIIFIHLLVSYAVYRSNILSLIIEGSKVKLVQQGKILTKVLDKEWLRRDEVLSLLRQKSVEDLSEIKEAYFETSGLVSILLLEEKKPLTKRDLSALEETLQ